MNSSKLVVRGAIVGLFVVWAAFASGAVVRLSEAPESFVLANGEVTATISKSSGDLLSLKYHEVEMLDRTKPAGHWHYSPQDTDPITATVTIDPASNGGRRAEVSVAGIERHDNQTINPDKQGVQKIEIRYCLGENDHGLYVYSILTHPADFPCVRGFREQVYGTSGGFQLRLGRQFNWLAIDKNRSGLMPSAEEWRDGAALDDPADAKQCPPEALPRARRIVTGPLQGKAFSRYDGNALRFQTPVYGWCSTTTKAGLWVINPSTEYLGGGATRVDLTGMVDPDDGQPTLVNDWFSWEYGYCFCDIPRGQNWSKVIGPFLLYCNGGQPVDALTADAHTQASKEASAWPYDWVAGVNYPQASQRTTVKGHVILDGEPDTNMSHILVGLTPQAYDNHAGFGWPAVANIDPALQYVVWQNDAKYYQFWTDGDDNGSFTIAKVRPGDYDLHILADGVLGIGAVNGIHIQPGQKVDLGVIHWKPVRYGRTLWEIGSPTGSGDKFRRGDDYWHWGLWAESIHNFPAAVDYRIGVSDFHKDWNYAQVPTQVQVKDKSGFSDWIIRFGNPLVAQGPIRLKGANSNTTIALSGTVILRIAFAATAGARGMIAPTINGASPRGSIPSKPVIRATSPDDFTIFHEGIRSIPVEQDWVFDAGVLQGGDNELRLHLATHPNPWLGFIYDYVRLESGGTYVQSLPMTPAPNPVTPPSTPKATPTPPTPHR